MCDGCDNGIPRGSGSPGQPRRRQCLYGVRTCPQRVNHVGSTTPGIGPLTLQQRPTWFARKLSRSARSCPAPAKESEAPPSRTAAGFDIFSLDDPRKKIEEHFAFPIRKWSHDPVVRSADNWA